MRRMSIIRSMHHDNGDHFAAAHWMLTGCFGSRPEPAAAVSLGRVDRRRLKGAKKPGMPAYVGLPNTHSVGTSSRATTARPTWARAYNPFIADGDPNSAELRVPS